MGVTTKPNTSRQNQNPHGKTKNLTAKLNTFTAEEKTLRQNQMLNSRQNRRTHGKTNF